MKFNFKLTLKSKLIFFFLLAGLLPMLVVGIYSYRTSSKALESEAINKLIAVRNISRDSVKRYFEGIRDQVLIFSHDLMIQEAMTEFSSSFKKYAQEISLNEVDQTSYESSLKDFYENEFAKKYREENNRDIDVNSLFKALSPNELAIQYNYIGRNPHPLGSKHHLDKADDQSTYSRVHAKFHPSLREFLLKFGYYDIFLIDIETGHIVYSVFKEIDFATSLIDGPYAQNHISHAFREASKINDKDSFVIVDYKMYPPSFENPASFIASPVWQDGKKIGVVMFQMPIDKLNSIVNQRSGMGQTGEAYLFGKDRLMRSDSIRDSKNYNVISSFKNPLLGTLKSGPVSDVINGREGSKISLNYLNEEVISAYSPIDILGLEWGLIAEISTKEAFAPVKSLKNALVVLSGLICLVIALFAFLLSNKLSLKIKSLSKNFSLFKCHHRKSKVA